MIDYHCTGLLAFTASAISWIEFKIPDMFSEWTFEIWLSSAVNFEKTTWVLTFSSYNSKDFM